MNGIDCTTTITAALAARLKTEGYGFVGRYLVPVKYAWKRLTRAEAEAICGAGLRVLCVYETTANRAGKGAAAGVEDGRAALAEAQAIGMPTSGAIYFAVDYDAQPAEYDTIAAYLAAAKAQLGGYPIGVYAGYRVIEAMTARGVCDCYWQTYAWSGGKKSAHRTVYQYSNGQTVAGITADLNEAESVRGFWTYADAEPADKPAESADAPSAWAAEAWARAKAAGILDGTGPRDPLTREQLAVVLDRLGVIGGGDQ